MPERWISWQFIITGGLAIVGFGRSIPCGAGGIATDGTLGAKQSFSGTDVSIPQGLGKTVGKNLFYSFSEFNVKAGQTVTFKEAQPNSLDNVISRVTGKSGSDINGTLRSTPGGHADFYLINPNGVAFGPKAQIDVPAAFHVSTADELKLKDGGKFSAADPGASTLSSAPPMAFGFLGTSKANNGLIKAAGSLGAKPIRTMDMVAGQIKVDPASTLSAPGGEIRLIALRGQGEAPAERLADHTLPLPQAAPSGKNAGPVSIGSLDTSGKGGGRIGIWGGAVKTGAISANNTGAANPAAKRTVEIHAGTLALAIESNGSRAGIAAQPQNSGKGGNIDVAVSGSFTLNSQIITSGFASAKSGDAGHVSLKTGGNLTIRNEDAFGNSSGIFTGSSGGTARSGNISVLADGNILIGSRGTLDTSTGTSKPAGNVTLHAMGNLSIRDGGAITSAAKFSTGDAGNIQIHVDRALTLRDGGLIRTSTFADGDAGAVDIETGGALAIDNAAGQSYAGIFSRAEPGSIGKAADITLKAHGGLLIDNHGFVGTLTGVFSQAAEKSTGDAGKLSIAVDHGALTMRGGTIASSTGGRGSAGQVEVRAADIHLGQGAAITAEALAGTGALEPSSGKTANLSVAAQGGLSLSGQSQISLKNGGVAAAPSEIKPGALTVSAARLTLDDSEITAATTGNVNAGPVTINAQSLSAMDASAISSSTSASGAAGRVTVRADTLSLDHSYITAEASATSAGRIEDAAQDGTRLEALRVDAANSLSLVNGSRISIRNDGTGAAAASLATLRLSAPILSLDGSQVTAATSGNQRAGNLAISAASLSAIRGTAITSSTSGQGAAGNITVEAGSLSLNGTAISAQALQGSSGQAGNLTVNAARLIRLANQAGISIKNEGHAANPGAVPEAKLAVDAALLELYGHSAISAETAGNARAGSICVGCGAPGLSLLAQDGASISSSTSGSGAAGDVRIVAAALSLDGAQVSAAALPGSGGQTGDVSVSATDSLRLANQGKVSIENAGQATHPASVRPGVLTLSAPDLELSGGLITAATSGKAGAGSIMVNAARSLDMAQGAAITSSTSGSGAAGDVAVTASRLALDHAAISAEALPGSGGQAGDVTVQANQSIRLGPGGVVSIANQGFTAHPRAAKPGRIEVKAPAIFMDGGTVDAATTGNVAAGSVRLRAADVLSARHGAEVTSSTTGAGAAGSVEVSAGRIALDASSIAAQAGPGSSGRTGDIAVNAADSLSLVNNSRISLANAANVDRPGKVAAGRIAVEAPEITLSASRIDAHVSGNVDAGRIAVSFGPSLTLKDNAYLRTTANTGDGGAIAVRGAGTLTLSNSGIETSVAGSGGNGGDILVAAENLLLETGLIRANAVSGRGGAITLDVQTLAASGNSLNGLDIGGADPLGKDAGSVLAWNPWLFGGNIVQAVSLSGISGTISLMAPQLNLSGALANLGTPRFRAPLLEGDACGLMEGSSLTVEGRGGLPRDSRDLTLY